MAYMAYMDGMGRGLHQQGGTRYERVSPGFNG